jgi:hypothetical protein
MNWRVGCTKQRSPLPKRYTNLLCYCSKGLMTSARQEITAKQAEAIIPDATARQNALNFLLGVGLLKGLTSSSGQLLFRAVSKEEIVA